MPCAEPHLCILTHTHTQTHTSLCPVQKWSKVEADEQRCTHMHTSCAFKAGKRLLAIHTYAYFASVVHTGGFLNLLAPPLKENTKLVFLVNMEEITSCMVR